MTRARVICDHVITQRPVHQLFKNDLQYRVHLATLIILMLIGSTIACLS